jgi:hypothetical protein
MEKSYRVHDMVLDLVCLLPSEENFVTRLHDTEQNSGQIQRQEIQDYIHQKEHMADMTTVSSMPQMWSLGVPV